MCDRRARERSAGSFAGAAKPRKASEELPLEALRTLAGLRSLDGSEVVRLRLRLVRLRRLLLGLWWLDAECTELTEEGRKGLVEDLVDRVLPGLVARVSLDAALFGCLVGLGDAREDGDQVVGLFVSGKLR
jgi:hypothetical protein